MNQKTCAIDLCGKPHNSRGWCRSHYEKWRRHGDPLAGRVKYATPEEAFLDQTGQRGECLVWEGGRDAYGYGAMRVNGKPIKAHRYSYERIHGPIPEGLVIDHKCHNKSCVAVTHLRAITQKQNLENRSGVQANSTSGYRGVFWHVGAKKWMVRVQSSGKGHYGGLFSDKEEANLVAIALRNKLFTHNDADR